MRYHWHSLRAGIPSLARTKVHTHTRRCVPVVRIIRSGSIKRSLAVQALVVTHSITHDPYIQGVYRPLYHLTLSHPHPITCLLPVSVSLSERGIWATWAAFGSGGCGAHFSFIRVNGA